MAIGYVILLYVLSRTQQCITGSSAIQTVLRDQTVHVDTCKSKHDFLERHSAAFQL